MRRSTQPTFDLSASNERIFKSITSIISVLFVRQRLLLLIASGLTTPSVAAFVWFAFSSCLGANIRHSLSERPYTPVPSWRDTDASGMELDNLPSSRLR